MRTQLHRALSRIPSYSQELGLDLRRSHGRFKWFLASVLFAKRISADIAKRTYREFEREGLTTPDAILQAGWDELVRVLDAGGYVRYDFSTASTLLETMKRLKEMGGLERIHDEAKDPADLERKLMELKGVGPTAVNIFLRELRGIWRKADPKPSDLALKVARRLGLKDVKGQESQLVRISLEFCKRRKCGKCPVSEWCGERARPQSDQPR
ncbi:MAG: hypothetical protein QW567_01380 [Candidatus Hadarchaeales archaeon]